MPARSPAGSRRLVGADQVEPGAPGDAVHRHGRLHRPAVRAPASGRAATRCRSASGLRRPVHQRQRQRDDGRGRGGEQAGADQAAPGARADLAAQPRQDGVGHRRQVAPGIVVVEDARRRPGRAGPAGRRSAGRPGRRPCSRPGAARSPGVRPGTGRPGRRRRPSRRTSRSCAHPQLLEDESQRPQCVVGARLDGPFRDAEDDARPRPPGGRGSSTRAARRGAPGRAGPGRRPPPRRAGPGRCGRPARRPGRRRPGTPSGRAWSATRR